jgi:hypothetical protein
MIRLSAGSDAAGPVRLVYILAASHSGSTLLAMLLGGHPELCTVGELKVSSLGDVERYRCSCGTPILSCPFWLAVGSDLAAAGHSFRVDRPGLDFLAAPSRYARRLLRPLHRGPALELIRDVALSMDPSWAGHLARVRSRNAALVRAVLARTGRRAIVDSSKVGLRLKYLLRDPALDVKVIRLMRDGRAVALTYVDPAGFADAAKPELRGGGMGGSRAAERLSMAQAAREWRRCQEEAEALLAGLPRERWTELRYEDLCTDSEAALRRLFAFLGVRTDVSIALRKWEHHVIGNGMRLDTTREVRLDDRWRATLAATQLATFDAVAGDMNRRLGYL